MVGRGGVGRRRDLGGSGGGEEGVRHRYNGPGEPARIPISYRVSPPQPLTAHRGACPHPGYFTPVHIPSQSPVPAAPDTRPPRLHTNTHGPRTRYATPPTLAPPPPPYLIYHECNPPPPSLPPHRRRNTPVAMFQLSGTLRAESASHTPRKEQLRQRPLRRSDSDNRATAEAGRGGIIGAGGGGGRTSGRWRQLRCMHGPSQHARRPPPPPIVLTPTDPSPHTAVVRAPLQWQPCPPNPPLPPPASYKPCA